MHWWRFVHIDYLQCFGGVYFMTCIQFQILAQTSLASYCQSTFSLWLLNLTSVWCQIKVMKAGENKREKPLMYVSDPQNRLANIVHDLRMPKYGPSRLWSGRWGFYSSLFPRLTFKHISNRHKWESAGPKQINRVMHPTINCNQNLERGTHTVIWSTSQVCVRVYSTSKYKSSRKPWFEDQGEGDHMKRPWCSWGHCGQ